MARIPKEHEDAMIEAYLNGATQKQAAALFGYDKTTCSNVLKRRGIAQRTLSEARQIPRDHQEAMVEAYLKGASASLAASMFGYTDEACFKALKRRGITPRSHAEACRIPPEHEDAIVAAYLAGATQAKAAALYGYSGDVCLKALRRRGITPRSHAEVFCIPQEHEDAIIAAYLAGAGIEEASALFGYSGKACFNALRRRGITPRSHAEACRIPPEHEEKMVASYLAGSSTDQAAALFGYNGQTCTNILKRRGITPRSHEEVCRKYAIDESFFDKIDAEEKAYWLGFLTADGGIVRQHILLSLKISDIGHLHKFTTALHSEHPISIAESKGFGKTQHLARVAISSVKLTQALLRLGVGENKSFTVRPCEHVPESLLNAYWRGIIDGDGSILCSGSAQTYWEVSLVGNLAIVTGFRDFVRRFVSSNNDVKPHKNIYRIRYAGLTLVRKIVLVLYSGATIYLDRKYEKAKKVYGDCL